MVRISFDAETGSLGLGPLDRWNNIPVEMRARRQWATASLAPDPVTGKKDKRPRRADGSEMAWRDPLQWMTFDEAVAAGAPAIGYILSQGDPFVVIDLDIKDANNEPDPAKWTTEEQKARHTRILQHFPSYAELSQSGRGVHIVLYGSIGGGLNRDGVEIYDQDRFMICTGNVLTPGPIQSHPAMLERLVHEMGGVSSTKELPPSGDEPCGDDELINRIVNSRQGAKFQDLMNGTPSSEADAALLAILAFWTPNHDQILRIFARSSLYRPRGEADGKKGHTAQSYHEKYLRDSLAGALALRPQGTGADLEHGRELVANLLERVSAPKKAWEGVAQDADFPPGLVGEIAQYIYHSAPYPSKPVAIAGALAFMAGVFGRQYTILGGECLNLYIALLAPASSGKDAMRKGINALFKAVEQQAPGVSAFSGPEGISATGWRKALAEQNACMVSLVGEIGTRLQTMLNRRAGENEILLKRFLLDVYTAGNRHGRLARTAHAKQENQIGAIDAPALTLLGESTPHEFYKAVTMDSFADGLVPRFILISYKPPKEDNYNYHRVIPPSPALVDKVVKMASYVIQLQTLGETGFLEIQNSAWELADRLRAEYIQRARQGDGESNTPEELMASRAWVNILKVAGLVAVGRTHPGQVPNVTAEDLAWAQRLVEGGVAEVARRHSSGDLATEEAKQLPALVDKVKAYFRLTDKQKKDRKVPAYLFGHPFIPHTYIHHQLRLLAPFSNSSRGADAAIRATIQTALETGILQRLTTDQVFKETGGRPPYAVYVPGEGLN